MMGLFPRRRINPFPLAAGQRKLARLQVLLLAGLTAKEICAELECTEERLSEMFRELSADGPVLVARNPSESACAGVRE